MQTRILGTVLVAVLALSGCADDSALGEVLSAGPDYPAEQLNKDVVEASNRWMKQNGVPGRVVSADCEDMEVIEKDAIADCTLTHKDGTEEYARVTMQDDEGHFLINAV